MKLLSKIYILWGKPTKCLGCGRTDSLVQVENGKWICRECDYVHYS